MIPPANTPSTRILDAKQTIARRATACWQQMDGSSEADVRTVARKFGLAFSTLVYDTADEPTHVERYQQGLCVLAGGAVPEGPHGGSAASFIFNV